MFTGTYTALVTPFRDGGIDEPAFRALIEEQIASGVDGIVPVGTTGESPTLTHAEHTTVIRIAVETAAKRCQVVAGTGSNSTDEAISLTREAEKLGADGCLLVAPYYNKPSQEGLYRHFGAIAQASDLPIILYSIPGRCGIEIGVETIQRLAADYPTVVAVKEAGGTVERVSALKTTLPDAFLILSGDDSLTLPFLSVGAVGVISVASNLIPKEVVHMGKAWTAGKPDVAQKLHLKYYRLFKDLFIEPNPVPVKYALSLQNRMTPDVRLPLCALTDANAARLTQLLRELGIPTGNAS